MQLKNVIEKNLTNSFLINSKYLDLLSPKIKKASETILEAIDNHIPILIRHHADCDGYTGAIAIEKAVLPLIIKKHINKK